MKNTGELEAEFNAFASAAGMVVLKVTVRLAVLGFYLQCNAKKQCWGFIATMKEFENFTKMTKVLIATDKPLQQ